MKLTLILLMTLVLGLMIGYMFGEKGYFVASEHLLKLETSLTRQQARLSKLQGQLNAERLTLETEQSTNRQLQQQLTALNERNQQLSTELRFYRRIMKPDPEQNGVMIQSVRIRPTPQPGRYEMELVLIKSRRSDATIEGVADVEIQGKINNRVASFHLGQLSDKSRLTYRFRFFQEKNVQLILPDGFDPDKVIVDVAFKSSENEPLRQQWLWEDVTVPVAQYLN